MGRNKPLKRAATKRREQRRFLVYCEDRCAGKQYFQGLRAELRFVPIQLGAHHGEPSGLVREAIAHRDRAPYTAEDRRTAYDEVWCVIDVECPPHERLADALCLAEAEGIRIALCNPCFDLWLLLHFSDVTAHQRPRDLQRRLEAYPEAGFAARRKHVRYVVLAPRYAEARGRAQLLRQRASEDRIDRVAANPWTDVDVLVDTLRMERSGR